MRPIIGITSYAQPARWGAWELPAALVPLYYVDSVEQAGGRALVVPPSEHAVDETLDVLDGIVFSGGIDIDPAHYGAERHPATDPAQAHRDAGELRLLEAALERDIPTLAICRGFQLLNVLRGGDLIQHLPEEVGHEGHRETLGVFSQHPVEVKEGTRLEAILGPRHGSVRSSHHQGVGRVGERARRERLRRGRLARGDRGSVEAVRRSACSGIPRWKRTTSACSRRSSPRPAHTARADRPGGAGHPRGRRGPSVEVPASRHLGGGTIPRLADGIPASGEYAAITERGAGACGTPASAPRFRGQGPTRGKRNRRSEGGPGPPFDCRHPHDPRRRCFVSGRLSEALQVAERWSHGTAGVGPQPDPGFGGCGHRLSASNA